MKLQSITPNLMVEDVQQTINYYHGVLGFETIDTVPENGENLVWANLKKGDVEIMIQEEDSLKNDLPEIRHEKIGGGTTLFIKMTGVQEYYDYLYSSADVVVQIKDTFYGTKEFTIRDINGYYLTFAELLKNN